MFQLETETKARLRPTMVELGVAIEEHEQSRQTGRDLADSVSGGDWTDFVAGFREVNKPLLQRQRKIAASAPEPYRELAESMAKHGESFETFIERESAGDVEHSIDALVAQLKFPLPVPR